MDVDSLDIKDICCFGYSFPAKDCWLEMLRKADGRSWKGIDKKKFEKAFSSNVDACYYRVAAITFVDLGTDIKYFASFDNGLKKWTLEIPGSSFDAIDPKDVVDFFNCETFKQIAARINDTSTKAVDYYKNRVSDLLEQGEFLDVDETKVEAIVFLLEDSEVRKNLRMGKYKRL